MPDTNDKPVPVPDGDTRTFWDAMADGRLLLQVCAQCERPFFYPRSLCPNCGCLNLSTVVASGLGIIYSYTVVYRTSPEFMADVPYVVAIVTLDEGPRMMTVILDCKPDEVRVDLPVQLAIQQRGEFSLPAFRPSS